MWIIWICRLFVYYVMFCHSFICHIYIPRRNLHGQTFCTMFLICMTGKCGHLTSSKFYRNFSWMTPIITGRIPDVCKLHAIFLFLFPHRCKCVFRKQPNLSIVRENLCTALGIFSLFTLPFILDSKFEFTQEDHFPDHVIIMFFMYMFTYGMLWNILYSTFRFSNI